MQKFDVLTGVAAPLPILNIDTDMIIPKQYLKTIKRTGLGKGLFSEMRYHEDGSENADFILNKAAYRKAQILVADVTFVAGTPRARVDAFLDHLSEAFWQTERDLGAGELVKVAVAVHGAKTGGGGSSASGPPADKRVSIRSPSPRRWWMTIRRSVSTMR